MKNHEKSWFSFEKWIQADFSQVMADFDEKISADEKKDFTEKSKIFF